MKMRIAQKIGRAAVSRRRCPDVAQDLDEALSYALIACVQAHPQWPYWVFASKWGGYCITSWNWCLPDRKDLKRVASVDIGGVRMDKEELCQKP
jgi:hypothetical protein